MKHITKIKEIIEEIVISENNDKAEYLVNFRTNEKIYTDYEWGGEAKILMINGEKNKEDNLEIYLKNVNGKNNTRKENYYINQSLSSVFIPDKNKHINLTDRQVLDLYIERVKAGRIKGDFVKDE